MKRNISPKHIQPTTILNTQHPLLVHFTQELLAVNPFDERTFLQMAHQRMAVLEAVAPVNV